MAAVARRSRGSRSSWIASIDHRLAWTATFTAATTLPCSSCSGAESARSPSSNSWSTSAKPCARIFRSSASSASGSAIVDGVIWRSGSVASDATSASSSAPAIRTRPSEVAKAGSRVPTVTCTDIRRFESWWAM